MSQERKASSKLARARRQNEFDEEDGEQETGPAIIDDSASEGNSEDELQLSGSDEEEEEEEETKETEPKLPPKVREISKGSTSPPTSDSYDRLEDDTLQGTDFVDLAASNGSVGPANVTDTLTILNGFQDIPVDDEAGVEEPLHFDEIDDSISLDPQPSHKKTESVSSTQGTPPSSRRGGIRERTDRETYWQKRNREREEYKKRLEDPTFTPYVGEFFMHDSRKRRPFDSLNQVGGPRGRGRGRGGARGGPFREGNGRSNVQQEPQWRHDAFEELEPPRQKSRSEGSSHGRRTPQQNGTPTSSTPVRPTASQNGSVKIPEASEVPSRPLKNGRVNVTSLTSTLMTINISLPDAAPMVKDITLNSYVGRIPYQKPLRGDRPVKISSIKGAGDKEVYPSKERSWLPYFLKNAATASQAREGVHSRGGSSVSAGTPSGLRQEIVVNGSEVQLTRPEAVEAPGFTPHSPMPPIEDEDDKPTKIKVNLPQVAATTSSTSPAASDSSSLLVHHPRPTKHINIADINDSSARLKAFLNPRSSTSPTRSHERTSSAALPETAIHAAPFQPATFIPPPPNQHQQTVPSSFVGGGYQGGFAPGPYYTQVPNVRPNAQQDYSGASVQNPFYFQQPAGYESNGTIYYYDPYYYYPQDPNGGGVTNQPPSQPSEQSDPSSYYYPPSQLPDPQRGVGMYPPYQQGT